MGRRRNPEDGSFADGVTGGQETFPQDKNLRQMGGNPSELASLVDSATTSPANELDLGLIKSIKQLVRSSDANVHVAFDLLMEKLKKNHAQVRYLALLVVDELFTRSKLFRSLLAQKFETFMLLSIGFRSDCPLPPPANRATLLRAKSMEVLEKWNDVFGPHYKPLRLGYEYLKNTLHLQFPNLRQAAAQAEQQRKEREARSMALIQKKYESLKEEFPALSADIQSTLNQLDECFDILGSADNQQDIAVHAGARDLGGNESEVDADDNSFEEYGVKSLRHTLEQAGSEVLVPCETDDNKPVFDTVRDLCRTLINQHIPATQEWMSILIRVDLQDRESHDLLLRRVIDVRNQLFSAKSKCQELGIDFQGREAEEEANADDEIVWEVGEVVDGVVRVEGDQKISTLEQISGKQENSGQNQSVLSQKAVKADDNESSGQRSGAARQQLLQDAPVLPWGSFLDRWGTENAVPANQRGLLLENHWGKVDYDALIPADKFAEINMRASYYKSLQTEIQPCLAPLRRGGLCQRRDLRVCPLHGPIIPRDCNGNPIPEDHEENNNTVQSAARETDNHEINSTVARLSSEEEVVKAIAAKAVANVRRKDEDETSKKRAQRLQTKRDREHNAAVLRDAALARTSQGLGETLGQDLERFDCQGAGVGGQSKRAKASLKAMLQPKLTAKDRLAERLLNERVRDATVRQLSRDEEAAYREAFTNQW